MSPDREGRLVYAGEATVPSGADAPHLARELLAQWLDGLHDAAVRADAALLVSELVTNSVLHAGQPAGSPVQIRAEMTNGAVRVEVEDGGNGTVRSRAPGRDGFGLHLVERLAASWGVNHEHGTHVWFELATGTAPR
jgi:anti-sigma regulatory factor (Ser/Thr protein kinase)